MSPRFRAPLTALLAILVALTAVPLSAQEPPRPLDMGRPVMVRISNDPSLPLELTVPEDSTVSLQAFGEGVHPTLTIYRDGQIVAEHPNTEGTFVTTLTTFLARGAYQVVADAANDTTGPVVIVLAGMTPIIVSQLELGTAVSWQSVPEASTAIFRLTDPPEGSFVDVRHGIPGARITLRDDTIGREVAALPAELVGGRFYLSPRPMTYRLEIVGAGTLGTAEITVCFATVSAPECGGAREPAAIPTVVVPTQESIVPPTPVAACTVRPAGGPVNVRASASMQAPIIGTLPAGANAPVLGIAPDGFFYNVPVAGISGISGWVAASVVISEGNCAGVAVVQPPPFVPVATAVPTQAPPPPAPPTAAPPAQTPEVPAPTDMPSGPCLLTLNAPVFVYIEPRVGNDVLFDQVQSGELIPTGRLADNTWWRTSYAGAWVQTSLIGDALTQSGNCAGLPVVAIAP